MLDENLLVQNWNKRINYKEQKSPRMANVKDSHRAQWPPSACWREPSQGNSDHCTGSPPFILSRQFAFKNQDSILENILIVWWHSEFAFFKNLQFFLKPHEIKSTKIRLSPGGPLYKRVLLLPSKSKLISLPHHVRSLWFTHTTFKSYPDLSSLFLMLETWQHICQVCTFRM